MLFFNSKNLLKTLYVLQINKKRQAVSQDQSVVTSDNTSVTINVAIQFILSFSTTVSLPVSKTLQLTLPPISLTSFSASLSSASFSLTRTTNICLMSSSFFCMSARCSCFFFSYVSCRLHNKGLHHIRCCYGSKIFADGQLQ